MVCYDAYRLDVNIADSESPVLSVGPLLPILIDPSIQELELEAVEGLPTNLPFSLQITAVNREIAFNSRVTFSKLKLCLDTTLVHVTRSLLVMFLVTLECTRFR